MSRRTRVAAGAVVSAVLLAALLWFTDPREIWRTLSQAELRSKLDDTRSASSA